MPKEEQWDAVAVQNMPLEELKAIVCAMTEHLKLRLERREVFYGEPEYRFVPKD